MNIHIVILLVATIAGFFVGALLRGLLIRRLPDIFFRSAAPLICASVSPQAVRSALAGKADFHKIRPLIEGHVDEFLGHRLGKEMPMIGMFIGDKTIGQLKALFMKELEEIFPVVMDRYVGDLTEKFDPNVFFAEFFSPSSATAVQNLARKQLRAMPLYAALAAFLIGVLQIIAIAMLA